MDRPDHKIVDQSWIAVVVVIALEQDLTLLAHAIQGKWTIGDMHFWDEMIKAKGKAPNLCDAP